ncbi:phosphoribosyl 1,2-cyclic phosphodiesterase [Haloferula luteola]|uniref:Phosphoribosyl 1,2-cyclic phosphodiesterase n=1 Tax=Haloferula luteola TaxID=595692 RepID=A0A840VD87_9BACT|nr:MBL fold metallo-hydrolase [Haloferula luteola]MBB5351779.1 phosphoribosyl 1,2-cyclic phosphodiesterase [Haloferula luteola]
MGFLLGRGATDPFCSGMRFAVLGSGSGGNATVIDAGGVRVLVDAGLSAKQITLRLAAMGIPPESLDAVLLTHEHGDHIRGLRVLMKSLKRPIYATPATSHVVREGLGPVSWKVFESGGRFEIGALEIESFAVPHDAVEPVGFLFRAAGRSFGLVSDSGHVTPLMRERLRGVEALFIEANYDDELLEADLKRPWSTKQRISSRHGHLSNRQTAELVRELAAEGLQRAVLGHLSRDCNAPARALEMVGACGISVCCAGQDEPSGWHEEKPPCSIDFAADELFGSSVQG